MSLNLTVGQPVRELLTIQIYDTVTGNVLGSAVESAPTYAVDNVAIAAIAPDATTPSAEDVTPVAAGNASITGTVTVDLSAYGLGTGVVLNVDPLPVVVSPAPPPPVVPAARFVAAPIPAIASGNSLKENFLKPIKN